MKTDIFSLFSLPLEIFLYFYLDGPKNLWLFVKWKLKLVTITWITQFTIYLHRISYKVSWAIISNFSLLGATNYWGMLELQEYRKYGKLFRFQEMKNVFFSSN